MLPAIASGMVTFIVVWIWWLGVELNPFHQPAIEFRAGLTIIEGMLVAFPMLLAPAFLAGSLAGEKERGSIGLLLTTRVSAADIVLGRLAAGCSQVLMIELAILPALLLLASLCGMSVLATLSLLALPLGVAFGGAGIALAASAISRRGRDALLLVYLLDVLFLLSPQLAGLGWNEVELLNPFVAISPMTENVILWPSLVTTGIWVLMGIIGLALASWRLRPSCLSEGNAEKSRKKAKRRVWVPPMDDNRPMLWKELHVERVGTLGRAGRWIGALLVLWMGLGSLGLLGYAAWGYFVDSDPTEKLNWAVIQSSLWYGNSAMFIGFLIQWAIGLRAAVTISSERERGTWDALLTSPLEGGEIIRGKLWGSLFALKWLIGSALLAWTITAGMTGTAGVTGMTWSEYAEQLIGLAVIGPFIAAVGVRTSLKSATATKSMGITMGFWIGAYLAALFVAWVVCAIVAIGCVLVWMFLVYLGLSSINVTPWFPMSFRLGTDIVLYSEFLIATIMIVGETRVRFDRVAGRMTGGKTAVAIDRLIHGIPMAPVFLGGKKKAVEPEMDEVIG
jgi:ABC-type transport system involved in multi-copper enzyme maturation permease subunit